MKALRYLGANQLEVMEVPTPSPKEGEVLLRIKACGICGSDVHGYLGLTGRRTPPMTMGHEFVHIQRHIAGNVKTVRMDFSICVLPDHNLVYLRKTAHLLNTSVYLHTFVSISQMV